MNIMPSRYDQLAQTLSGLQHTGVPLIKHDSGMLKPACTSDDCGIYYIIPQIAHMFGITINASISVFYLSVIIPAFLLGCIGVYFLFRSRGSRIISWFAFTILALSTYRVGDVYIISAAVVISLAPLALFFSKRGIFDCYTILFSLMAGLLVGAANILRSQSGTAVFIFVLILIATHKSRTSLQKLFLTVVLIAGLLMPIGFFGKLIDQRDAYLSRLAQNYELEPAGHPFWHSVYIGLGFISNTHVEQYLDQVAIERVRQIDPNARFLSDAYNNILKAETLRIIKSDPYFFFLTVGAKLGVVMLYLLLFSNLGLLSAFFFKKGWSVELAFWASMIFCALFGMLVVPHYNYLLGFIAFATIYGTVGIDTAIEQGFPGLLKQASRKIYMRFKGF